MKLISTLVIGLLLSLGAFAYNSPTGADPKNENHDQEYKAVVKSAVATISDAVSKGHILSYTSVADGYTVSRVGENTVLGTNKIACVAGVDIATGDVGYARCVTKGFVDFLRYDATTAISAGSKLCVNSVGAAVVCAACDNSTGNNSCKHGNATAESGIVALEAKASGTGSNLKALINLK